MWTLTYQSALESLEEIFAFAKSIGVRLEVTRFGDYRRSLEALVQWQARKQPRSFLPGADRVYIVPLMEVVELVKTLRFLRGCPVEVVRQKLHVISSGPVDPVRENPVSNKARNILFEIGLAARLWEFGLKPVLGDSPDLACEVDHTRLIFECKRPFSPAKVKKNIVEAADQLRRDLRGQPLGTRGMIAISLSKILNPGNVLLTESTETVLRNEMKRGTRDLAERHRQTWSRYSRSNILGILFHRIGPATAENLKIYVVAEHWHCCDLVPRHGPDGQVIETLSTKFSRLAL